MALFADQAIAFAQWTGGLVDPTLIGELERCGYAGHFDGHSVPLAEALALAPARTPARPSPAARWREVEVDLRAHTLTRPPGLRLDSGGLVKGLIADILAAQLGRYDSVAIDAAGDLALAGCRALPRAVNVISPFDDTVLHAFELRRGAAATSGIGKRSWLDADGRPCHHLIDPATGRPAFTGVVQITALAPRAAEAEARAKAALLSGPARAAPWLEHGGVIVRDDGSVDVIAAR